MSDIEIKKNLQSIHQRIKQACEQSGRNPKEVSLLLATKTVPIEKIQVAIDAGETLLGENKIQEALSKQAGLQHDSSLNWHFIGHLQTNKVKDVLKFATCIQSVDRMKLANKLDERLRQEGRSIDILVQVNTSYEESKFGIKPEEAIPFIQEVSKLDTLRVKGLMTIGLFTDDKHKVRKCFRLLKDIQTKVKEMNIPNVEMGVLSMGMSGDLEIAIDEGATMIRVGTAVFGKRIYSDSYYWNENSTIQ